MNLLRFSFVVSLFFLTIESICQTQPAGNLVIVGGGLEADNKSVYQQLITFAGGAENAKFAVVPSASGVPMQSYVSFRNILISYGLKPENIFLIKVALVDDDSTSDVNESEWKNGGSDIQQASLLSKCSAVWFTGGDQIRTMKTLYLPDGSQTPVLKAVWDVYRLGGVIGGTSAGAAIMSGVMIGGGTSLAALKNGMITNYQGDDFPEDQGVLVTKGLGFFPHGIVDQHFNARARFGRLTVALVNNKQQGSLGFGVDENTALIYNGKQNKIYVAGAAGVTIFDASGVRISYVQKLPFIENIAVNYLSEGDSYSFATGIVTPAKGKISTSEREPKNDSYSGQDGILSPYKKTLRDLIVKLAEVSLKDPVSDVTGLGPETGFQITLRKTKSSEGFYAEKQHYGDRYTVKNILMDITPVHISATPIINK
ncbi:MAG: cyanophycinase [bacterium]